MIALKPLNCVDRRVDEIELFDVVGKGKLGDRHLIAYRSSPLLGDLRLKEITVHVLSVLPPNALLEFS
jgi:hypothetical protein